jgi:HK97 family phage portal protein
VSLFSRRRVEARAVSYQDVWGRGLDVFTGDMQSRALSLAPVYGAVRLIADNLSTIPFSAYRSVGDVTDKLATQPPLLEDPTQHGTVVDWRMRLATSLALRGNAMGFVTSFDGLARPKRVEWLNPADVQLVEDNVMVPARWRVLGREVDPARIVHIPLFVLPGRVLGLSPIRAFKQLIESGLAVEKFGLDWFHNGAIPSGLVTNETGEFVSKEEAEIVKARFKAAASGRDVVAMGGGWKYTPITVPPKRASSSRRSRRTRRRSPRSSGCRPTASAASRAAASPTTRSRCPVTT